MSKRQQKRYLHAESEKWQRVMDHDRAAQNEINTLREEILKLRETLNRERETISQLLEKLETRKESKTDIVNPISKMEEVPDK